MWGEEEGGSGEIGREWEDGGSTLSFKRHNTGQLQGGWEQGGRCEGEDDYVFVKGTGTVITN